MNEYEDEYENVAQWNITQHKKEWNNAIWNKIDGPKDYHTKWSQKKKDKYHITYMWNIKHYKNELIYKTETYSLRDIENKPVYTKGEGEGRDKLGV